MSKLPNLSEDDEAQLAAIDHEDEDERNNIVPSDRLAAQSSAQLEDELARFRNQWKMELLKEQHETVKVTNKPAKAKSVKSNRMDHQEFPRRATTIVPVESTTASATALIEYNDGTSDLLDYEEPRTNEDKAKYLFDKAVQLEQQGRHYEAIRFYRMAMQLDADIEFKLASNKKARKMDKVAATVSSSDEDEDNDDESADEKTSANVDKSSDVDEFKTMYEKFNALTVVENKICEKNFPQKATHISQLPVEVMMIILKWVISEHIDMRSLDKFAAVCKGFYVLGRDPRIWRLACAKIWGENNINNYLSTYSSWRMMYLQRPRLNFDGVYISKSSYARAGEQGLDNFYQPWHLVEYYRYLRFFSDGSVLFLTTPDEPKLIVSKLKTRGLGLGLASSSSTATQSQAQPQQQANFYQPFIMNEHSILKGTWTLALKKVSIVLIKRILKSSLTGATSGKYSRRQAATREPILEQEHVFRLELELNGKMNNQLHWVDYNIDVINKITSTVNNTKFDLNKIDFPNFYYSRVKSYSSNTDMPLK